MVTKEQLVEACEILSVILHELEGKGVELSEEQDHMWGDVTELLQIYYEESN